MNYKNLAHNLKKLIDDNLPKILELRSDKIIKSDNSYVTKGDLLISNILKEYLKSIFDKFIYVSEEDFIETENWNESKSYIFVDPLDGTENFVSGLKEWGIGISIYENGIHIFSFIYLPELSELHYTGKSIKKFDSRINGLSSSLNLSDLKLLRDSTNEIRIMGCAMYNIFNIIRGSFNIFENIKGVNCWDILPGINLALDSGCKVYVDGFEYKRQILFPIKKYKIKLINK